MASNVCTRLLQKRWRHYEVENIPRIEGIYVIGTVSRRSEEPKVISVGRSNDVHRRLVEHQRQHLAIDEYIKEQFQDNDGEDLRVKWITDHNQEIKEREYIYCIAEKVGYWPKYNIKR